MAIYLGIWDDHLFLQRRVEIRMVFTSQSGEKEMAVDELEAQLPLLRFQVDHMAARTVVEQPIFFHTAASAEGGKSGTETIDLWLIAFSNGPTQINCWSVEEFIVPSYPHFEEIFASRIDEMELGTRFAEDVADVQIAIYPLTILAQPFHFQLHLCTFLTCRQAIAAYTMAAFTIISTTFLGTIAMAEEFSSWGHVYGWVQHWREMSHSASGKRQVTSRWPAFSGQLFRPAGSRQSQASTAEENRMRRKRKDS
jgi:hypothetical protein